MQSGEVQAHVETFIAAVEGDVAGRSRGFLRAARLIADATAGSGEIQQVMGEVSRWAAAPLDPGSRRRYLERRRPGTGEEIAGAPGLSVALSVAYLRATRELQGRPRAWGRIEEHAQAPGRFASKVRGGLAALEADFKGALLVETEERARMNPKFADELREAFSELEGMRPELEALQPSLRQRPGSSVQPKQGCTVNGNAAPDYICVIGAIVIVVLIIVTK